MNVQEYISSGIVESYVLGLATPEEQAEFEQVCARYAEVRAAREAFELALEQQALQAAVPPPAALKTKVLEAVFTSGQEEAHVVPLPVQKTNVWKYAAAAAVVLLVGSIFWNLSLVNQNKANQSELTDLKNQLDTVTQQLASMQKSRDVLVNNPNIKMAAMKGLDPAPGALAAVYWDSVSKDVYLMINNLPAPASGKQYQLWALLNGQPVDLGVIPNEVFIHRKDLLLTMKNTIGAQAFAITLETMGGNPSPQGQMYTLGNL